MKTECILNLCRVYNYKYNSYNVENKQLCYNYKFRFGSTLSLKSLPRAASHRD